MNGVRSLKRRLTSFSNRKRADLSKKLEKIFLVIHDAIQQENLRIWRATFVPICLLVRVRKILKFDIMQVLRQMSDMSLLQIRKSDEFELKNPSSFSGALRLSSRKPRSSEETHAEKIRLQFEKTKVFEGFHL